jgi:hypothetical protein
MKKRVIPTKNYIIFSLIAILSFLVVFNLARWYNNSKIKESIVSEVLLEVLEEEFDEFVIENGTIAIYMSSSQDDEIVPFEQEFKDYIIDNELQNEIVYFDTSKVAEENFFNELRLTYFNQELITNNIMLNIFPNIIVFKDHQVSHILYIEDTIININDVNNFFDIAEVMDN